MSRLRILRVLLGIGPTSAPYNQFSLAARTRHAITLCTVFPPSVEVPPEIALHTGDGTVRGFLRALDAALAAGPYDVIHVHKPHVGLPLLARVGLGRRRPPVVFTVHNSYQNFSPRNRLLLLPMFALADRVVCCGRQAQASFPRAFRALAGRRFDCVPNGVDLARLDRHRRRAGGRAPEGPFTILVIGRLIPVKNPRTALDAFARSGVAGTRLRFIGEGPLRARLEAHVAAAGLGDRVDFTGLIPREAVYDHCLRAHLVVSTSRGEGLPIAVLEAMASELPVVLSDIPPHREIVEDGGRFIPLVPPDDVDGFARAIARVAALPDAARTELGRRGRALVEARFSLDAMLEGYERVFGELLAARGRAPVGHVELERR